MTAELRTRPLISIRSNATVQEAAGLMADCSMGAIGVLDEDKEFAGIITERDLSWFVAQGRDASSTPVSAIANDFPIVVEGPITESDAVDRMKAAHVRHLIVHRDNDFRIVSMRDIVLPREKKVTLEATTDAVAGDVMTAPAVACRAGAYFEEIAEILAEREISGMPVVDDSDSVIGVISERDLARAFGGPMVRLALKRHTHGPLMGELQGTPRGIRRAQDIMSMPPLTVDVNTHVDEVARIMRVHEINRVPVLDEGRLVGVVTRGDVLASVAHLARTEIDRTRPSVVVGGAGTIRLVAE
jgi:CBS domain-containing membrane protein